MNKDTIKEQIRKKLLTYDNYLKVAKHTVLCPCKDCRKVMIIKE